MFPAQAQQHRSRLAQQHALSEQLASGRLTVAQLVAVHLTVHGVGGARGPAPSL
jgi:hypothetical protein